MSRRSLPSRPLGRRGDGRRILAGWPLEREARTEERDYYEVLGRRALRHVRRAARRVPRGGAAPPSRPRHGQPAGHAPHRRSSTGPGASCATRCAGCTTTTTSSAARRRPWTGRWRPTKRRLPRGGGASRGRRSRPSRWHQPQWRNVAGFRVPADVFMAGPQRPERAGSSPTTSPARTGATHSERYWLRYAAGYYRERGRIEDWIGALERLVELEDAFDTLVQADLRAAYVSTGMYLRGIGFLRQWPRRYPASSSQRRWVDRELRALLGEFRDQRVRRGTRGGSGRGRRAAAQLPGGARHGARASPTCAPRSWRCAGRATSGVPRRWSSGSRPSGSPSRRAGSASCSC